jgi:BlaI family transcriptional regulator, penicillinase repressor
MKIMQPFTPSELEVMQVLWEHGRMKPAEIEERFPREIKNAALRSILLILLEKGHVARRKVGKAYYYEAKTPSEGTLRSMARRLADVFCGGSTAALIAQLIRSENLSPEDVRDLERIARGGAGIETQGKKRGAGRKEAKS